MDTSIFQTFQPSLQQLQEWKDSFGVFTTHPSLIVDDSIIQKTLRSLSERLTGNYPFHHPNYAGQMLKPPHPIAALAYSVTMGLNPNNHALDGGPPSSEMEKECVEALANLFGYNDTYLGHLSSSGTIANLEALWIARCLHPNKGIAYSNEAHYTHSRMAQVLDMEAHTFQLEDENSIAECLEALPVDSIGTLIVTMGTTGLGKVEPLSEILDWAQPRSIRIHIDAAYGGFFKTISDYLPGPNVHWDRMQEADSIVIDPHKHGLQPYGCGCVLFKNPEVGVFYKHDSPYTYFSSEELHLGEISLECSRAGASAAAFWATLQCFPLEPDHGFGPILTACHLAAIKAYGYLDNSEILNAYIAPELDIVAYYVARKNAPGSTSTISDRSKKIFHQGMSNNDPSQQYYISLYTVNSQDFSQRFPEILVDSNQVVLLRSVLMRPEQEHTIEKLLARIEEDAKALL
ncbi:MAG: pyridoxal-dependent decarboxylase [Bacteroidota bacterium]|nr:pyridoxal-dependent decarboxylase [Bacteroidota bacterium]